MCAALWAAFQPSASASRYVRLGEGKARWQSIIYLQNLISRATGRSATGAAAYRAGVKITDERTGQVFDYTRKRGIDYAEILAPANATEWAHDRAKLWNA